MQQYYPKIRKILEMQCMYPIQILTFYHTICDYVTLPLLAQFCYAFQQFVKKLDQSRRTLSHQNERNDIVRCIVVRKIWKSLSIHIVLFLDHTIGINVWIVIDVLRRQSNTHATVTLRKEFNFNKQSIN